MRATTVRFRRAVGIGGYRTHADAMQVLSGPIHKRTVHFEAPPSSHVPDAMKQFITWFNDTAPGGKNPLSPLTRAGIAHLYFVCVHPFEDGDGHIVRALAEKSLAQTLGQPSLIAIAALLSANRLNLQRSGRQRLQQGRSTCCLSFRASTTIQDAMKAKSPVEAQHAIQIERTLTRTSNKRAFIAKILAGQGASMHSPSCNFQQLVALTNAIALDLPDGDAATCVQD
jgi:Fic family protein